MAVVSMRQLLEAGVHFGHQTRRWDPKMSPFIFGERNGIHIIDLRQTIERIDDAYRFIKDLVTDRGTVLFVGTKKQSQHVVQEEAERCEMPYVNHRWLGGMMTNFHTIHKRILYMHELARMDSSGEMEALPKKERLRLRRELEKLRTVLGGVGQLQRPPDAVFIVDINAEEIAVKEATRLKIPIIAVVDTNCNPDPVDWIIPGNDDAIRAAQLLTSVIADACIAGNEAARERSEGKDDTEPEGPVISDAVAESPEVVAVQEAIAEAEEAAPATVAETETAGEAAQGEAAAQEGSE